MREAPTSEFVLRLAADGEPGGPEIIEVISQELRTELTLSISINMSDLGTLDANRTKVTALWLLLPLTAGATAAAGWLFGRETAERPR